jgi:hypothetical protein
LGLELGRRGGFGPSDQLVSPLFSPPNYLYIYLCGKDFLECNINKIYDDDCDEK